MRQALQAIEIASDPAVRLAIMLEKIKITVREGHRDYHIGSVVLFSHIYPWAVLATITSVRHTTVEGITEEEYMANGYKSRGEMLRDLRKHYPGLTMKSKVTVVTWELSKNGYFADIDNLHQFAQENGLDMRFE